MIVHLTVPACALLLLLLWHPQEPDSCALLLLLLCNPKEPDSCALLLLLLLWHPQEPDSEQVSGGGQALRQPP
jgi:hypothetical protein